MPRCRFQLLWARSKICRRSLLQGLSCLTNNTQKLNPSFHSPCLVAKADLQTIKAIFADEKQAKQILSAAKRVSKKRTLSEPQLGSPTKRKKLSTVNEFVTPLAIEGSLSLPTTTATEEELLNTTLYTNRAPLVLAFAVTLLKYTMPEQPLSSRLSLAQAVVSMNSRSKAVSLGIEKGNSAEDDNWGQGQPKVRIMGRDISVMKRWEYDSREHTRQEDIGNLKIERQSIKNEEPESVNPSSHSSLNIAQEFGNTPALWGLDLEALRSSNGRTTSVPRGTNASGLPIYTPHSARAYLLKSFAHVPSTSENDKISGKRKPARGVEEKKEQNLALLLKSLELLYGSWSQSLTHEELDGRSWAWYVAVRPEVQDGVAGWGAKGKLKLSDILNLRKQA